MIPSKEKTFKAFNECPLDKLKVVFISQEPYPKYTQATGLAFGIDVDQAKPTPGLLALIRELENDLDTLALLPDYSLTTWANQGVLLLNSALTLRRNEPGSHADLWKPFMIDLFKTLSERYPDLLVVTVGQQAESSLQGFFPNHLTIPKLDSAEFPGCKIFSKINNALEEPIDWKKDWKEA